MKCPVCGAGNLVRESRDLSYTYGSRSTIIRQSGDFCDACGEGIFSSDESEHTWQRSMPSDPWWMPSCSRRGR